MFDQVYATARIELSNGGVEYVGRGHGDWVSPGYLFDRPRPGMPVYFKTEREALEYRKFSLDSDRQALLAIPFCLLR